MVGWHHQLNGHGFEWTLDVGEGQGGLASCGSWGHKESDRTKQPNNKTIQSWLTSENSVIRQYTIKDQNHITISEDEENAEKALGKKSNIYSL